MNLHRILICSEHGEDDLVYTVNKICDNTKVDTKETDEDIWEGNDSLYML